MLEGKFCWNKRAQSDGAKMQLALHCRIILPNNMSMDAKFKDVQCRLQIRLIALITSCWIHTNVAIQRTTSTATLNRGCQNVIAWASENYPHEWSFECLCNDSALPYQNRVKTRQWNSLLRTLMLTRVPRRLNWHQPAKKNSRMHATT